MGSSPDKVVEMLKPLNLPQNNTRVLDLGCGKGAVSITLSKELGFKSVGIDACKPFLEEAKRRANQFNVSDLCRFEFGDIRNYVKIARDFDVVVYASLGNILGGFNEIVGQLRKIVRSNGYMIIDDGFLKTSEKIDRAGYEHYVSYDETIVQLTSHGDKIMKEIQLTDEENREIGYGYLGVIKKRAAEIIIKKPELKEQINEYLRNQEIECEIIDKYFCGAIWLLQKVN